LAKTVRGKFRRRLTWSLGALCLVAVGYLLLSTTAWGQTVQWVIGKRVGVSDVDPQAALYQVSRERQSAAFSVAPFQRLRICFRPSAVIPSATTTVWSAPSIPSSISTR
jgi:hypothetical protein